METKNRKKLEALLWRKTHRDYKGKLEDGTRTVLHMSAKTYGTELWPLSHFTDEELVEKIGPKWMAELA